MAESKAPYKFAEEVRTGLEEAQTVAVAASAPCVEPIHILHSLLKGPELPGVLSSLVPVVDLRTAVASSIGAAPRALTTPSSRYSSRCKRVLENAMTEARDLHHAYVSSKHILLGILRMKPARRLFGILPPSPDPAYAVLTSMGVTYDAVRTIAGRAA
jgi:ATP-dependent Clp protease ATP-binding subunit ClpC